LRGALSLFNLEGQSLVQFTQPRTFKYRNAMRKTAIFVALAVIAFATVMTAQNNPPASSSERKVASRAVPSYPDLAKRMRLQGVVKVEAIVRPNGSVKSARILGGNPVLVQSALDAVNKWKFEPAPDETTEIVQVTFIPQ
jgi:TonB family protein